MSYNLIFIDESESMQRAVATVFLNDPEFKLSLIGEPSSLYKAAKNFTPDIIVLSYNTIDTELKKSITEIKTSREFSNTPLILLVPSDLSDNERETLIKLKSDGFIYRPFDKDSFISKIKRTLSGDGAAANAAEKIYDIASFENKKTNEASNPSYPEEKASDAGDNDNKESRAIEMEPSELSQAFENLFKDDAIFKEFQDLNKKEEPPVSPAETIEPAFAAPAVISEEIMEPPAEPVSGASGTFGPDYQDDTAEQGNPAGIFELSAPAGAFESAVSFDSIAGQKEEPPEEHAEYDKGVSASDEPFAGFNIALGGNTGNTEEISEPETYKSNEEINIKKPEGELNLKILDEQNLVKLDDYLKSAIEKAVEDISPQIIENIKTGLPEIIERLVKEEIEKIKQQ
jgi:DNA-binding response OmpR family regulator